MIQINDLHITQDKKYLVIDVLIKDGEWYKDVYLSSIYINTLDEFKETGAVDSKIEDFNIKLQDKPIKHYRNYINLDGTGVLNSLLFIWINAEGDYTEDTPCGLREKSVLGITYDKQLLYTLGMRQFNSIDSCNISGNLIDYILKVKAFEINLKAGNYTDAIKFWKMLSIKSSNTITNNCKCYGTI